MRFSPEELQSLARVGRQYPEVTELLNRWRQDELEQLLLAPEKNTGVLQGRARMLTDVLKHMTAHVNP